jgi:outer membrane protein TolC
VNKARWKSQAGTAETAKVWAAAILLLSTSALAQQNAQQNELAAARPQPNLPEAPSAVSRPLLLTGPQSVPVQTTRPGALSLTLDEAIQTALKSNTQIRLAGDQEAYVRGEQLSAEQALIPDLKATAYARAQEIDLVALGFKPGAIKIPGVASNAIPSIVKVNTNAAQLSLSQAFDTTALFLYRATERAREATTWSTLNVRGGAVLQVGGLYLRALADQAMVRNAEALVQQDELVFEHAQASKAAGVGINLDVLRAQVQLQNEQQALESAKNAAAKDKIQLNRAMGLQAGQDLDLVDAVPYSDFNADSSDDAIKAALAVAYERRKDLRQLQAQLEVARATSTSLKYERLPTIGIGGYYGVLGEIGGLYHGVFTAEGQVSIPIFQEAQLRGQKEIAASEEIGLRQQIDAKKAQIEADIRSALLDVQSAAEVVKVARSNVDLAQEALNDATLRFTSGVDDNLPVVQAQAALTGAQVRVIQSEFNYNYAKLVLARNTGVVETQYRTYLGR